MLPSRKPQTSSSGWESSDPHLWCPFSEMLRYFYSRCLCPTNLTKVLLLPRQCTECSPKVKRSGSSAEHFTQHSPKHLFLSNIHSSSRWFFGRRAFMLDYPSTPSHMQWRDRLRYGSVVTCLIIHWRTLNVILVSRLLLIVSRSSPRVDPGSDCGPVNPVRLIDVSHRVPWLFL